MKTELGVSMALLAALSAQGKDFDRATLDAMLEKLATSPEPEIKLPLAFATCYIMSAPKDEPYEYVCPTCGLKTNYAHGKYEIVKKLDVLRAAAVRLRGKGLDIALDERCMCRSCGRDLVPTGGEIVRVPSAELLKSDFRWHVGDKIVILSLDESVCVFAPGNPEYWVAAKYVSNDGKLLRNGVQIRTRPDVESAVYGQLFRSGSWKLNILPRRKGDPDGWLRVEKPAKFHAGRFRVLRPYVGNLTYGDRPDCEVGAGRLSWLMWRINGKFHAVRPDDVTILEAVMEQRPVVSLDRDRKRSLKSFMPRLRTLLQNVPEPPSKAADEKFPADDARDLRHLFERPEVEVEVDI